MKKRSLALLLALLCVVFSILSACGSADGKTKEILASDGTIQCVVPDSWQDLEGQLNQVASLEVADVGTDCYMVAIPELKDDFDADLDLEGYNKIIIENVTNMAKDAEIVSSENIELGENPAILTKVKGTVEGVKIMYWVCSVEFPSYYTQVMGWTLSGKADKYEEQILSVVRSVTEISENAPAGTPEDGAVQ